MISNRLIKLFIAVVAIVVIFFLVSPFIVGKVVQSQFFKVIDHLNQDHDNKSLSYSITKYDSGWYHSKATFAVKVKLADNKFKTYSEIVNIKHGPLIFNLPHSDSFKSHFELAYFSGTFHLDKMNKNKASKGLFVTISPININYTGEMNYKFHTNLLVDFDKLNIDFKSTQFKNKNTKYIINTKYKAQDKNTNPVFSGFNIPNGGKLNININKNISKITTVGQLNGLSANISSVFKLDYKTSSVKLKSVAEKVYGDAWQGKASLMINKMHVNTDITDIMLMHSSVFTTSFPMSTSSDIDNFNINFGSNIDTNKNSYSFYFKTKIDKVTQEKTFINKKKEKSVIAPLVYNLSFNNFNLPAFLELKRLSVKLNNLDEQNNSYSITKSKRRQIFGEIFQDIPKSITKDTNIKLYYGFDKQDGNKVFVDTKVNWGIDDNTDMSSLFSLIPYTHVHSSIYFTKPELAKLFGFVSKLSKSVSYKQMQQMLNSLVSQGYVTDAKNHYQTLIETHGPVLMMNNLLVNINEQMIKLENIMAKSNPSKIKALDKKPLYHKIKKPLYHKINN